MPPITEQVPVSVVDAPDVTPAPSPSGDGDRSRFRRTVWRTHFYAGVFAMPVLVMLAITGLVILYTDPINDLQFAELQRVEASSEPVTLDEQREAVEQAYAEWSIQSVIPPKDATTPTTFVVVDASGEQRRNVMVDPSTATVLGDQDPGAGIVGLANRLHGTLNNESVTVPLPTLPGLLGDGPALADLALGDVVVEIFACWALVLAVSGIYLWWPRKKGTGRALFVPRLGRKGRARWRDLHAVPGIVLSGLLVFLVATGLPWSGFWGANWAHVASEVTPNEENFWELDAPSSDLPEVGDLDRVGNRIPWATTEQDIPTSSAPSAMAGMEGMDHGDGADDEAGSDGAGTAASGGRPAPISLDLVQRAAADEGMLAGATITFPFDDEADPAAPVYGSFVVTNPWPSDISNQGALFVDQFSGETLGRSFASEWGQLQWVTELGVQTHMGTQFGLASRVAMTLACVLVLWAAFSGLVMFAKRRRGGTGFPRRPVDARLQRGMIVVAVLLALIYPLWGLSALVVLVLDKYVIRKVPPLRRAFGMR
jgi:uncharacterized iron-regulated membrane protein